MRSISFVIEIPPPPSVLRRGNFFSGARVLLFHGAGPSGRGASQMGSTAHTVEPRRVLGVGKINGCETAERGRAQHHGLCTRAVADLALEPHSSIC